MASPYVYEINNAVNYLLIYNVVINYETPFTCGVKKSTSADKKPVTKDELARKHFGKRLKTLRKKAGHSSQLGFAYENGFNVRRYGSWELGADIKLSNIVRLCDSLGISLADFFSEGFDKRYRK